ncbi:hypothetical protein SAMN05444583_101379 [Rhodococcus maanshanensis]|uniref:DUF4386 family protein n=1 Tax=Rhodococcus maanshanensis TaxID=183556 RepID=A0A1H7G9L8_9NOCA|nr:hypothetical protein SAMN05444583_101379 [Rhodococcus maanshanensis]
MPNHLVLRIGGVAAIVGGILIVGGVALHPRERGQLHDAEHLLEVVAGSGRWVGLHVVILIGIALLLGAFYGLTHSVTGERGIAWARLAWSFAIVGVGLGLLLMLIESVALPALAETWSGADPEQRDLAASAGSVGYELAMTLAAGSAVVLCGATPLLYGVAIIAGAGYPSWLGWLGVMVGSISSIVGMTQMVTGDTTLTGMILFPMGLLVVAVWSIWLGALMLRKATPAGSLP